MLASKFGHASWVQYLVEDEYGFKDQSGRTALMYVLGSLIPSSSAQSAIGTTVMDDGAIEAKLRIIDFLFDYEWFMLDNAGMCCIDYLRLTNVDASFVSYLEDRFARKCISEGTPRGIQV